MLQYRNKDLAKDKRLLQAKELAALARGYGAPFIVNDDLDIIALAVGANGVHLGKDDGDLAARAPSSRERSWARPATLTSTKRALRTRWRGLHRLRSVYPSSTKPARCARRRARTRPRRAALRNRRHHGPKRAHARPRRR